MTDETLTQRIQDLSLMRNNQEAEVPAKFLSEARGHLRNSKVELAERKVNAAENVLAGGGRV